MSGADLRLENRSTISGGVVLYSDADAKSTLINSGRIDNEITAVGGGIGNDTVINSGLIRADVLLKDGDDRFIDKSGHVSGAILGGDGDDLYVITSGDFDLRETNGQGTDTVKTSVSWELGDYFEVGRLTGNKDINLTASFTGSSLYGNAGDNKLEGGASIDRLDGGRGDDILTGGDSSDVFQFKAGSGTDVVTDFADGADVLNLGYYKGIDAFNDLGIKQDGKDVVITLLHGDTITLLDFDKGDLASNNFAFG
jgi:Ca2+-binding RTX toxin-like protein